MKIVELTLSLTEASEVEKQELEKFQSDRDIFIYSGEITDTLDINLTEIILRKKTNPNVLFLLTTYGGDADAAFRTAKILKRNYSNFTLGVLGDCKSAGTIIAFGADEIIMSCSGEFGPLDVQMFRPDEFVQRTSGTIISQALSFLAQKSFDTFEDIFLAIRRRSGGIITTQTAADIASSLCASLFSPITEKIDPMRIGEMQRSLDIAIQYAIRLGGNRTQVEKLAKEYPCHSFVIDIDEASSIFPNVRVPVQSEEIVFAQLMNAMVQEFNKNILRTPYDRDDIIAIVNIVTSDNAEARPEDEIHPEIGENRPEENGVANNRGKALGKKTRDREADTPKA